MLEVVDLNAGYGKLTVLRGVTIDVPRGQAVAIFGRNGAGKSTLMKALVGLIALSHGSVMWEGRRMDHLRTEQVVQRGVALVPQSRGLFMRQTVAENLSLAAYGLRLPNSEVVERTDDLFDRFPALRERRRVVTASLSGGEQQMLAIAKALMRRPKLLLLDEPSIGLAPKIVELLAETVLRLREEGQGFMITEQNVDWVLGLVDRVYVLDQGQVAEQLDGAGGRSGSVERILARYLGGGRRAEE